MRNGQKAAEGVRRPSEQAARGIMEAAQKGAGSLKGTATACVALLGPQATLHVANVGDCGLVVFRRGECIFASEVRLLPFPGHVHHSLGRASYL